MNNPLRGTRKHAGWLALVLGFPSLANAQGVTGNGTGARSPTEWSLEITPYLWAAGLDGNTGANGAGSEIDTDYRFFSLENLDFALGTAVEARKGRWGMLYDAMYVEFSDAFERSPASEVEVSGGFLEAAGSLTARNGRPLELLFGLRYVALEVTVDVAPVLRASARDTWLDPFVGLRFAHAFNDRWSVTLRGDIGGFGVSSELATNMSAMFGWRVGERLTLRGGYRMLQMDFDGDSVVLDAILQGYLVGASWAFCSRVANLARRYVAGGVDQHCCAVQ
jgi:hypothetical protein